jgi:DNA-binding transcriptional ArsR family regulator
MTESTRALPHPDAAEFVLTDVLFALSDPARLAIVRQVAEKPQEEAACQDIGGGIPKSTRSHYLKTLREAGVIRNVAHGRQRLVSLRREELDERFPGLLSAILAGQGETQEADRTASVVSN